MNEPTDTRTYELIVVYFVRADSPAEAAESFALIGHLLPGTVTEVTEVPEAGPPASTDAVSPDERARGTSQAADTTAEAARTLGLTPRPLP